MRSKLLITAALFVALPFSAHAHRFWVLPAATVLSGDDPWVTVDAAVSNDIFYFNHHPLSTDQLSVTAPDGSAVEMQNASRGKHRSTFDLELKQKGTYKIGSARAGLRARWETEEGERRSWPGRGETPAPGDFDKKVPKEAKNLQVSYASSRLEAFITSGAPTDTVLKIEGKGLELKPLTHPNDLYFGEKAQFQFLIDGQPAVGTTVTIIVEGVRYRDSQDEIELTANAEGIIDIEWPTAGRYWLEAEYSDDKAAAPATTRQGTYIATLEVLPQ